MTLWRISNYADLSGEGGRRSSARWHTEGLAVVYLASSPASALLEILARYIPLDDLPDSLQWPEISVDGRVSVSARPDLDPGWQADVAQTRAIGDTWLRDRSAALLEVPSALVPKTSNYLLNPRHPDAARIRIASTLRYAVDRRLARN